MASFLQDLYDLIASSGIGIVGTSDGQPLAWNASGATWAAVTGVALSTNTIALGGSPATTGAVRLSPNTGIYAGSTLSPGTNLNVIRITNQDDVHVGNGLVITAAGGMTLGGAAIPLLTSTTDNRLVRTDGTNDLQESGITVSDTDAITGAASLAASSYIAIGTNPAAAGELRLPNNATIRFRDVGDAVNHQLVQLSSSDYAIFGNVALPRAYLTGVQCYLQANGDDVATFAASTTTIDHGTNVSILGDGYRSVQSGGTAVATSGTDRYSNNASAWARNAANTANLQIWNVTPLDYLVLGEADCARSYLVGTQCVLQAGGDNVATFYQTSAALDFGTNAHAFGDGYLSVQSGGTAVASAGAVRLSNDAYVRFRNAADSADIVGLRVTATDDVVVGETSNVSTTYLRAGTDARIQLSGGTPVIVTATTTTIAHGTNTHVFGDGYLAIQSGGAALASSGAVRLGNGGDGGIIQARNAGNTGNIHLISANASDEVEVGDLSGGVGLTINTADVEFAFAQLLNEVTDPGTPGSDKWHLWPDSTDEQIRARDDQASENDLTFPSHTSAVRVRKFHGIASVASIATHTVLTIDGDDIGDDWSGHVDVHVVWGQGDGSYSGSAKLQSFARRSGGGNIARNDGTEEIVPAAGTGGITAVATSLSTTNLLIQITTDTTTAMTVHAFVIVYADG